MGLYYNRPEFDCLYLNDLCHDCLALWCPAKKLSLPLSVFPLSPPSLVVLVALSSSSLSSQSPFYIFTASSSPQALFPMTFSPSYKTSHHQKAAQIHPGSTSGMSARNAFRSTTPTCLIPRVEKAVTFVFRTRFSVRIHCFSLLRALTCRWPSPGRPRMGKRHARDDVQRSPCLSFKPHVRSRNHCRLVLRTHDTLF